MKYKIISDSSSDVTQAFFAGEAAFEYGVVPMSINGPGGLSYLDLDPTPARYFVEKPREIKGQWSSSCPSPAAYLKEMQGAEEIFVVTISSRLSASYSTACMAADMARAENPDVKIHVVDSKSASSGMALMVFKLAELCREGLPFEEIVEKIEEFRKGHTLYFLIGSLETLVSAGRMNRVVGMMATMLNIHPLCGEDGDGNIKVYQKVRGMTQALNRLVEMVGERGETQGRHLVISQCNNPEDAEMLSKACQRRYQFAKISVLEMRGLASFYAGDRGLILAY